MTTYDIKKIGDLVEQKIQSALKPIDDKLDNHTVSLMNIENTLEGYADMYKVNKEKIEELGERITSLENNSSAINQK